MASGNPTRWPNGFTQDESYQPLGQIGIPDPFFYSYYEDDFVPYNGALYTATLDGGTAAQTVANGGGGRVKLTTAAVSSDFVGLQLTAAPFLYTAGYKMFYCARVQVAAIANTTFIAGLCQTTATPATITDGIYFKFTAGGTYVQLIAVTGSTVIGTLNLPTSVAPVNNTDLDVAFYVDRRGNIIAFCGPGLFGNKSQQYAYSTIQPIGKMYASGQSISTGSPVLSGTITTAYLNPTIAVFTTAAAAESLVADFQAAGTER
jgi:hypothetical protein